MSKTLIQGKFYRVSYNGEGIYEALRKKVGWDWKTVKQDPDINWLPTPEVDEYKDSYRSYFTTLGYKTFQAKTIKVIDKYLDPKKIKVNEYNNICSYLMYKDQYQVVIDQGDEIMNETFKAKTTMNDLVAFRRDFNEYVEDKLFTPPKPDNVVNEKAEYLYPIEEGEEIIVDEDGIAHKAEYLYPLNVDMSILENPDEDLLAYRKWRRPILEEMQRKFHLSDEEIEEMRITEESIHLWARQTKGYNGYKMYRR